MGRSGACTVLVDGTAIDYLHVPGRVGPGLKLCLTVEGLQDADGGLSPIQRAFVEEAAVQCGFCTPGIIIFRRGDRRAPASIHPGGIAKLHLRPPVPLHRLSKHSERRGAGGQRGPQVRGKRGNKDKRETPVGRLPFCGPMRASAPTAVRNWLLIRAEYLVRGSDCAVDNDSARTKGGNSCHPGKC